MDPINSLNGLAEILRKRIASEAAVKREGRTALQQRGAERAGHADRVSVAALRMQISDTVRTIDPDDPNRNRKALRAFVENVLAWQFGAGVLNDPAFSGLVAEVQDVLEKDPAVSGLLESMLAGK